MNQSTQVTVHSHMPTTALQNKVLSEHTFPHYTPPPSPTLSSTPNSRHPTPLHPLHLRPLLERGSHRHPHRCRGDGPAPVLGPRAVFYGGVAADGAVGWCEGNGADDAASEADGAVPRGVMDFVGEVGDGFVAGGEGAVGEEAGDGGVGGPGSDGVDVR